MELFPVEVVGGGNYGKFAVARFEEEWDWPSQIPENQSWGKSLLRATGIYPQTQGIWVIDLQTREGAYLKNRYDLGERHQIWTCPLFPLFHEWLWRQDLSDLSRLPNYVEIPDNECVFSLFGFRWYPSKRPTQLRRFRYKRGMRDVQKTEIIRPVY